MPIPLNMEYGLTRHGGQNRERTRIGPKPPPTVLPRACSAQTADQTQTSRTQNANTQPQTKNKPPATSPETGGWEETRKAALLD